MPAALPVVGGHVVQMRVSPVFGSPSIQANENA